MSALAQRNSGLWIYCAFVSAILFFTYSMFFLDYFSVNFWVQDFFKLSVVALLSVVATLLFSCIYLQIVLIAQTPIGREFELTEQIRINPLRGWVAFLVCLVLSFVHATVFIVTLLSNEIAPEFFAKYLTTPSYLEHVLANVGDTKVSGALIPADPFKSSFFYRAALVFKWTDEFLLFIFYFLFVMLYSIPLVSACVHIRAENLFNYREMQDMCEKNGILVDYDHVYRSSEVIFLTRFPKANRALEQTILKLEHNANPSPIVLKDNPASPSIRYDMSRYTYHLRLLS